MYAKLAGWMAMNKENKRDESMLDEYTNTEFKDLQSVLDATKSSIKNTGEFDKLVPDIASEAPTWDCNGGVCVLEWKPKKPNR